MSVFSGISSRPQVVGSLAAGIAAGLAGILIAVLPDNSGPFVVGVLVLLALALVEPQSAVLLLLIIAPLKALIVAEAAHLFLPDIGQVGLVVVIIAWLVNRAALRLPIQLPLSQVHLPVTLFLLAALWSLPGALSLTLGVAESLKWAEMLLMISLSLALFQRTSASWLVFALVVAGMAQAVTGLYQFFGGSGADHLRILDGSHFRAFGTFGQPNPFGAFMGITLPLSAMSCLGYGLEAWGKLRRAVATPLQRLSDAGLWSAVTGMLFYAAASVLLAGGLLASWSRGAWMGVAGAGLVMFFFLFRSALRSTVLVIGIAVIVVLAWSQGAIPTAVSARMASFVNELTSISDVRGVYVTDENYAVTERIAHWQVAEWIARDHPWSGVGFGNYEQAYPRYALLEWQNPLGHAHNYYLNLLAETGIAGLLAYGVAWTLLAILTIVQWKHSGGLDRMWCIALLGIWAYLALHSIVDKLYVNNMFLHIGAMMGLLAVLRRSPEGTTG